MSKLTFYEKMKRDYYADPNRTYIKCLWEDDGLTDEDIAERTALIRTAGNPFTNPGIVISRFNQMREKNVS
ncbi:MAG: hypothetical protein ACYDBV_08685 [Nitrospiria bacterium]